ncbi:hypothetical protein PHYSODRAFT_482163 [Phytophthora sojae]|uniref:Uncharacterized protein n=1 Tax=Phytophthora sojae (strain P6497) TaxID=1094619 RepID=G4YSL8_PHYSP|nr:hypothetical protein PHYSODRAFT_482163 [Phytophthora sojae]EGZ23511.1 hypothetical protein PHYSODRAFT_482163 [Phytophthora sojae]|eukprot:XP_009518799.1 hypothetical protein PHYSODRAFT_482163 [Phytophthora sojae]
MESSEPALRRSKREHQPSAKAAASAASSSLSAVGTSAARRSQRRRVTHSSSPASTPASTRNSSPVRGTLSSPAPSKELVSVAVDAVGPNGQRRRLRAAAHTGTTSSVPHGVQSGTGVLDDGKVLGRYSSHDCALLCEVILGQLKRQTLAPTVLDERKSPAYIRWEPVAKKMETTHKLRVTPRECQLLWKFLAYGQVPVLGAEQEDNELLPDSDEEDFHKPPKQINAELAAKAAEKKKSDEVGATAESKEDEQVPATDSTTEDRDEQTDSSAAGKDQEDAPEAGDELESASSLRLYPTYSLPTGAPDGWYRPFAPKDALPLTFVASRFLRRKATPPLTQSVYSQAAAGTSAAGAADLKRKQQASAVSATGAKKPKVATPPVSTPPRTFTPSSTPPPAAQRARSQLEFFELRLREEQAKTTPGSKFELSTADIQRRFGEASPEVRRQCQVLAAQDVERFNREVVRVRIWQKAMGANNTKPISTLAPAPAVGTTSVSTKIPMVTKSSGPTAALLAHAAAVAATAAKARISEQTNTTAGASKAGEGSATTTAETK